MQNVNKDALLEAVNTLITSPDAHDLFDDLVTAVKILYSGPKLQFALTGATAVLNPLLDLAAWDPLAYNRVLTMIEDKRAALGFDPLKVAVSTSYDKTSYMRDFMRQKRDRQRRAAEIENLRRPARDKLMGNARLEFQRRQSAIWKNLRDEALEHARKLNGGVLTAALKDKVLDQFWETVDEDLDKRFRAAKSAALTTNRPLPEQEMADLIAALHLPARH